jgi:hypothetical protein
METVANVDQISETESVQVMGYAHGDILMIIVAPKGNRQWTAISTPRAPTSFGSLVREHVPPETLEDVDEWLNVHAKAGGPNVPNG